MLFCIVLLACYCSHDRFYITGFSLEVGADRTNCLSEYFLHRYHWLFFVVVDWYLCMDIISCMCRPFVIYLCYPQEIYFHEKFRPLSQCTDIKHGYRKSKPRLLETSAALPRTYFCWASQWYVRLLVWEADVPLHQIERTGVRSRCAPSSDRKNCVNFLDKHGSVLIYVKSIHNFRVRKR